MRLPIVLIAFTFFVVGLYAQQTLNPSILVDGVQREYILYVPASYSPQQEVPLVLNFHGYTSNANDQMNYGDFRSIADTAGFIIAHPQGLRDNSNITHFNVGWGNSNVDDLAFADALLDSLIADYAIDTLRIYSTGMSNGGFMSFGLACFMSQRIAAIASVTGSMSPAHFNSCNPQRAVPVMQIHGTNDRVVAYNGTNFAKPISDVLNYWVNANDCQLPATTTSLPNTSTNDGSQVESVVYSGGNNGSEVFHFKVLNGGHTWPGTANQSVGTNYDIDASAEVWDFFSQYDLNGLRASTTTDAQMLSKEAIRVLPNPFVHMIEVRLPERREVSYELYSLQGQKVQAGRLGGSANRLDLSHLEASVYILRIEQESFKIIKKP